MVDIGLVLAYRPSNAMGCWLLFNEVRYRAFLNPIQSLTLSHIEGLVQWSEEICIGYGSFMNFTAT